MDVVFHVVRLAFQRGFIAHLSEKRHRLMDACSEPNALRMSFFRIIRSSRLRRDVDPVAESARFDGLKEFDLLYSGPIPIQERLIRRLKSQAQSSATEERCVYVCEGTNSQYQGLRPANSAMKTHQNCVSMIVPVVAEFDAVGETLNAYDARVTAFLAAFES